MPDTVGLEQHKPTSLWGIANKAKTDSMTATPCIAEASTTEEPVAEKLHGGVCAGGRP